MYIKLRKMHTGKKAEMGVGTLIVFIAMLLVAAVAAGVLIQTAGSLQEKSLSTGQQARAQISTNARVIEVSGNDGRNGNLTDFQQIMKLSPGSDAIIIFTFNTKDRTSTMKYRGTDCICEKNNQNGYNTWNEEQLPEMESFLGLRLAAPEDIRDDTWNDIEVDLDDDGLPDYVQVCNGTNCAYDGTHLMFNLSQDGIIYVQLDNDNGTVADVGDLNNGFSFSNLAIGSYGYMNGFRTNGLTDYRIRWQDVNIDFQIFENAFVLEEDYDDDGTDDQIAVNDTHVYLYLSSAGNFTVAMGEDISTAPVNLSVSQSVSNATDTFATISLSGATYTDDVIPANASFTITPYNQGEGYFAVVYEQEGTNHVPGNLQRGDIIRLCYEAPGEIVEDELIRLNFIPKIGTATLTQFVTPDVISVERVYLYP